MELQQGIVIAHAVVILEWHLGAPSRLPLRVYMLVLLRDAPEVECWQLVVNGLFGQRCDAADEVRIRRPWPRGGRGQGSARGLLWGRP